MTVQDLFNQMLPRLAGPAVCSIFDAVRSVQEIVANRLLLRRSELLASDYDAKVTFPQGAGKRPLPEDFREFSGRPYLAGGKPLEPLAGRSTETLQGQGTPKYYAVAGQTLSIWPKPEAATVVWVPYFVRPEAPTALSDEIPFAGAFDGVFAEGCAAVLTQGLSAVANPAFVAVIQSQVDAVLDAKDLVSEQLLADSINGL